MKAQNMIKTKVWAHKELGYQSSINFLQNMKSQSIEANHALWCYINTNISIIITQGWMRYVRRNGQLPQSPFFIIIFFSQQYTVSIALDSVAVGRLPLPTSQATMLHSVHFARLFMILAH